MESIPQTQTVNPPAETTAATEPQQNPGLLEAAIRETETAVERLKVAEARFSFQQRRAKLFAASGLFAVKDLTAEQAIAQAMVKIELGESMGFSPAESLQGIHVINNATCVAAALRAARMQARGYSWEIDWLGTEEDCLGCRLWLYYRGKALMKPKRDAKGAQVYGQDLKPVLEQVSVAYTRGDAEKMLTTVWKDNQKMRVSILEKENWRMSPKNMYFARAITNAQRWYDPGALSVNLPSVEEMEDQAPQATPTGITGSVAAAEAVAEAKLKALKSGETVEDHDARLERQMAEQVNPTPTEEKHDARTRIASATDDRPFMAEENRELDRQLAADDERERRAIQQESGQPPAPNPAGPKLQLGRKAR